MKSAVSATIEGKLYTGNSPVPETATLLWAGPTVRLISSSVNLDYAANKLSVSPRVEGTQRFITLPDGLQFQCNDHHLLDRLPQEGKTEHIVATLEKRWRVALMCLLATVAVLVLGYRYGLPTAAEHIANVVPLEQELPLGRQSLEWLDGQVLQPTALPIERQEQIRKEFARLIAGLPMEAHYQLEFRKAPAIGPNAFALPGGIILLTDTLVEISEPREVLAILAHEAGHIERRHALRHVIQDSAVAVAVTSVAGDVSSLSLVVGGLPVLLAQMKYSREFEVEADEFAFHLLKRRNLSPLLFASAMERLTGWHEGKQAKKKSEATNEKDDEETWSFLSTHPVTAERIARARKAAEELNKQ